jgi:hypothetical protein
MKKTKPHWYEEEPHNQEDHYDLQSNTSTILVIHVMINHTTTGMKKMET